MKRDDHIDSKYSFLPNFQIMDTGHPIDPDYGLVGMKPWSWDDTLFYVVEWSLIFTSFVGNFESQYYFFGFGRNTGSLLSMLAVL